jgi:hypothetical protein
MGRIASVDYGYKNQGSCGTCGMEQKDGCCHTDQKIIKLRDDHQVAKIGFNLVQLPEATLVFSEHFVNFNHLSDRYYFTSYPDAPPDQRTNIVYLYNNVFRI